MIWNRNKWKRPPYASIFGSLMYAQTCTMLDISFDIGMLGNPELDY